MPVFRAKLTDLNPFVVPSMLTMKPVLTSRAGWSALLAMILTAALVAADKKSAPESSKVLFENDRTRVLEYHFSDGKGVCGVGLHSHPAHVFINLVDAKLRIVGPDGKEAVVDVKAGESGWEPAVTHRVETISGTNAACYLIEFKDKDWQPSTGTP